jgi:hypothetical protein
MLTEERRRTNRRVRRCSKLHRRPVHHSSFSRENVDGAESKFGFMLVAQIISHTRKSSVENVALRLGRVEAPRRALKN